MTTPRLTSTKADSVPMLTSSMILLSGITAARTAMNTPNPSVSMTGVPVRGLTSASRSGSSPSRHIAKKMRV